MAAGAGGVDGLNFRPDPRVGGLLSQLGLQRLGSKVRVSPPHITQLTKLTCLPESSDSLLTTPTTAHHYHTPQFSEEEIDMDALSLMSEEDLIALGLPWGSARKIASVLWPDRLQGRPTDMDGDGVSRRSFARRPEKLQ